VDPFRRSGTQMTSDLSERFAESCGHPIQIGDLEVHSIFTVPVREGQIIRVARISAAAAPVQGLRLKVDNGTLAVHGQELSEVVLWADTAPEHVTIECHAHKRGSTLKIWNAWRDPDGTMQAWLGNAGMVVQRAGARLSLQCSDGRGRVDFGDLIVEIDLGSVDCAEGA
jgi:hypothetical protein